MISRLRHREGYSVDNIINKSINEISSIGFMEVMSALETTMLKEPQADCPVGHHFGPGIYVREVNMCAGTFAIGHYQKKEHLNIFLKGMVDIVKEDGSVERLTAPMIFTGKPGRKVGQVIEDVCWLNVYPTTETDIKTLEGMFLDKSQNFDETVSLDYKADNSSYMRMLAEIGVTEDIVREQSENELDQIDFPANESRFVAVASSNIEGKGLFATNSFHVGDVVTVARVGNMRTPAGRYTNHSDNPNAKMEIFGDSIYIVSIKDISGCRGGQLGAEITVDYRQCVNLVRGENLCQV